jgi:NAD+ synthase
MNSNDISNWIMDYASTNNISSLVVGVSGGIDSAVTATLCSMTGLPTYVITIPIKSSHKNQKLAQRVITFLKKNYSNVTDYRFELTDTFNSFKQNMHPFGSEHSLANTKARLRMTALYQIAQNVNGIVVGTGNIVEDFGVGFFTKYGDGGVDIAPIAHLYKSEVYQMAKELGVPQEIIDSPPTDGLWNDNRTDEEQLGASYDELEWAMKNWYRYPSGDVGSLSDREQQVLEIFNKFRVVNRHKMIPIPTYKKSL